MVLVIAQHNSPKPMVGSMKYPVSESFSDSSSTVSNTLSSFFLG
jgi:hypothetical protein